MTLEWLHHTGFANFLPGQMSQFVNAYVNLGGVSAPAVDATLKRFICDVTVSMTADQTNTPGIHVGWWTSQFMNVGVGRDGPTTSPLRLDYPPEDERITGTGTLQLTSVFEDITHADWVCAQYTLARVIDSKGERRVITPGTTPKTNVTIELFQTGTTFPDIGVWEVTYTCYDRSLWEY